MTVFGPGLQRLQLLDHAASVVAMILADDRDRKMLQVAVEGIADDDEVHNRHQDGRQQRERIARQLEQVAPHDRPHLHIHDDIASRILAPLRHSGAHQQTDLLRRLIAQGAPGELDENVFERDAM